MGLQAKRRTKSSKKRRAAHFALKKVQLFDCPKCKKPVLPHHVCLNCGYYRGNEIIRMELKSKKEKKSKKLEK